MKSRKPLVNKNKLLKTHHCGTLNLDDVGKEVVLSGWVNKVRKLGGLNFITLRDKYGLVQLGFDEFEDDIAILKDVSLESVIQVAGIIKKRPDSAVNPEMKTGTIEVAVKNLNILSKAQEVPFLPHGKMEATEDLRLKYRYIDLRSEKLQNYLSLRSQTARAVREVLYSEGFTEVETPILYKTTPEGARDYVVPSRVHPGKVYALPQSPQTLKQLLMIGGTDRYFQICKCFRDEDLRADRQPEFTQIDIEVSFSTADSMKELATKLIRKTFDLEESFEIPIMSFDQAIQDYGSDKPDVRFGLKHHDVTALFQSSDFKTFKDVADSNGLIKSMFVSKEQGEMTRKSIDAFVDIVKPHGGKGVAWFKREGEKVSGGISKFINEEVLKGLPEQGDGLWLFIADKNIETVHSSADALRRHLGAELGLIEEGFRFLWVNDFPLFEYDEEDKRLYARHHPFTSPKVSELEAYQSGDFEKAKTLKAEAYDLVCNGYEIAGGSIRIYDQQIQKQMFKYLGMTEEEVKYQFGFFIEALNYGTPPHGGIAFGFDRLNMLLGGTDNIRDVIAFPKTTSATDLMASSPSRAKDEQLEELKMRFEK